MARGRGKGAEGAVERQTTGVGGEIQLTDAIRRLLDLKPAYGYRYPGTRHDIGNPAGYLKALQAFAASDQRKC